MLTESIIGRDSSRRGEGSLADSVFLGSGLVSLGTVVVTVRGLE